MSEIFLYPHSKSKCSELNVWLAFPGIYSFGMSALGYLTVFRMIDEMENVFIERIFTDTKNTAVKLSDVDIFGFSVSFELDFLSIFKLLEEYKIPLFAKDRDETHPLVFGGGPVLSANPEPFCMFFDYITIGDCEDNCEGIINTIKDNKHLTKSEILKKLSEIEGVYVPSLTAYNPETKEVLSLSGERISVKKTTAKLSGCAYTPILSEDSFFSNTFIVEVARGCPNMCGFCMASYLNLPYRCSGYEELIARLELGLKHTNKIALLGALICAHPKFDEICDYIISRVDNGEKIEASISSLRADYVSARTIEMLVKCGQRTATIAVECGSERLRKLINKNLTEDQIMSMIDTAQANGLHGLKIYAMIGVPTESYSDLDELINLIKTVKKKHKNFDITLGVSTFVPKAHTPFQFCQREDTKSLEKKYEYLKKEFHKIGVKIRCSSVKWDYIQSILSRGDRRLCEYLVEVYKAGTGIGCFKNTYKKMEKEGLLPPSDEFALNSIETGNLLPWDFIEMSPNKEFLIQEYNRLLS